MRAPRAKKSELKSDGVLREPYLFGCVCCLRFCGISSPERLDPRTVGLLAWAEASKRPNLVTKGQQDPLDWGFEVGLEPFVDSVGGILIAKQVHVAHRELEILLLVSRERTNR